jgi:hypothetical protein
MFLLAPAQDGCCQRLDGVEPAFNRRLVDRPGGVWREAQVKLLYADANPLDVAGPFAVFSRLPAVSAQLFSVQLYDAGIRTHGLKGVYRTGTPTRTSRHARR